LPPRGSGQIIGLDAEIMSDCNPDVESSSRWPRPSAWLLSACLVPVAILLAAAVALALLRRPSQRATANSEQDRVEVVLAEPADNEPEYFSDELTSVATADALLGGDLLAEDSRPPGASGIALPDSTDWAGAGEQSQFISGSKYEAKGAGRPKLPFSLVDREAILADDASRYRPEPLLRGPKAKLSLFGAPPAEGHSFVFVIDRSASMGGQGLGAIEAAAKELAAQINSVTAEQKFQVVAYNQSAVYFTGRELIAASRENKKRIVEHVGGIAAFGQTEHERGLLAALRLKPEVIFLLTDGGDPHLKPGQLAFLRDLAAESQTSIHCLHFGREASADGPAEHFLRRLAAENRGSYAYINLGRQ
jgi:hypothetical protein